MKYGFDTDDEHAATAALLVYAIYRSRDKARFKVALDMWDQIERFVKDAAKRSKRVQQFIENLKPRLMCGSLKPHWLATGERGESPLTIVRNEDGSFRYAMQLPDDAGKREFATSIIERADARQVLARAYCETAWVVVLVRERLEREKPIEAKLEIQEADDALPPQALLECLKEITQ